MLRQVPVLRWVETNLSLRRTFGRIVRIQVPYIVRTVVRTIVQTHRLSDFVHRAACNFAGAGRASFQNIPGKARIVLVFFSALLHGIEDLYDGVRDPTLALDASDASRPAAFVYLGYRFFVAEYFVQIANGTDVRITAIGAPHPRRIGDHRLQLLPNHGLGFGEHDCIVVGLRHLASVGTRQAWSRGKQGLRFGENDSRKNVIGIRRYVRSTGNQNVLLRLRQAGRLGNHRLGVRVDSVESPRDLTRQLNVRHLVFANRHQD